MRCALHFAKLTIREARSGLTGSLFLIGFVSSFSLVTMLESAAQPSPVNPSFLFLS